MPYAVTMPRSYAQHAVEVLRIVTVAACAFALIGAGQPLPLPL